MTKDEDEEAYVVELRTDNRSIGFLTKNLEKATAIFEALKGVDTIEVD